MDLLADTYGSSDDDESTPAAQHHQPRPPKTLPPVARRNKNINPAPRTILPVTSLIISSKSSSTNDDGCTPSLPSQSSSSQILLYNNPRKSELMTPVMGPAQEDPYGPKPQSTGKIYHDIESNFAFDDVTFDEQRHAVQQTNNPPRNPRKRKQIPAGEKDTSPLVHDSDDELNFGIWAPPSATERDIAADRVTDAQNGELTEEQRVEREYVAERDRRRGLAKEKAEAGGGLRAADRAVERKLTHLLPPLLPDVEPKQGEEEEDEDELVKKVAVEPKTIFHGEERVDYRGRSWIHPPAGTPKGGAPMEECTSYIPKKCVHRFTGHGKGVQRIRLFPKTGHLLLSAGLEGKCKVWSIAQKRVMRTYIGHGAAVRDVRFDDSGERFLSCSFDRFIRLWDTESGEVLNTFTNRRVPYTMQFYPPDNNLFLVGCSDNRIICYDATTTKITQEYNHHLAPVNTITFVENATKFLSSSDDKKILVWEWDIGVPIKYISDPTMHSIPSFTMHPSGMYVVGQSLDNQIVVYQARDRFQLMKKKSFKGHRVAGYACDLAVSPDGRFLVSGDGEGRLFFWDWKMHKILQKYRAHDKGPAIGCVWHPLEPSMVFSCGWDGVIKMWQ